MPILNDITDHQVIGRERERGMKLGREEEGRRIVLQLISKRFGPILPPVRKRIETFSPAKVEKIALRLLDARSLDELLK